MARSRGLFSRLRQLRTPRGAGESPGSDTAAREHDELLAGEDEERPETPHEESGRDDQDELDRPLDSPQDDEEESAYPDESAREEDEDEPPEDDAEPGDEKDEGADRTGDRSARWHGA